MRSRRHVAAVALVAVSGLAACQDQPPDTAVLLPAGPAMVDLTMREYGLDYDPVVPAGRVVFRVRNVGTEKHRLTMLPLSDDVPPVLEQLRGSQRIVVPPYAGTHELAPGGTATFAVDLAAGQRYALVCNLRGPDRQPHSMKGMASEFRSVTTTPPGGPA